MHFSADTRYKLYVNGVRVAVGPARSSLLIWYYDTLDIAPYLRSGNNEIRFEVLRYFPASRSAMPFERTTHPGLTVVGGVEVEGGSILVDLTTRMDWQAQVDHSILFPTGLLDDGFLHVRSRSAPVACCPLILPLTTMADQRAHYSPHPRPMDHTRGLWAENAEWGPPSLAPTPTCYSHARGESGCHQHS